MFVQNAMDLPSSEEGGVVILFLGKEIQGKFENLR